MKTFWKLLKKDVTNSKTALVLFSCLILGWDFFLLSRAGRWQSDLIFGLSWIPFGFLQFWAIWTGLQSYRQEWNTNTSYLMLSLPVPGWKTALSKLVASMVEITGIGLLSLAGSWFLFSRASFGDFGMSNANIMPYLLSWPMLSGYLKFIVVYWLVIMSTVIFSQVSFLIGRLAQKWQGLLTTLSLILCLWGALRFGTVFSWAFAWVPDIRFISINQINRMAFHTTHYLDSSPIVAFFVFALLLFAGSTWLLEREVEV